jgi:hypothetical protein
MTIRYLLFCYSLTHNLAVISNYALSELRKKGNDIAIHFENQQGCHAQLVEAQAG